MPTSWFYPNSVTQEATHPEYHIEWKSGNPSGSLAVLTATSADNLTTVKNLLHIANATAGDIRMKTWYLYLTNFGLTNLPETIAGVEIALNVKRSRVVEDTVQLLFRDELIGENQVYYAQDIEQHIKIVPNPTYGGDGKLWGATLTKSMLQDPTFGICLRFQSHPYYPHSEAPLLESVALRVHG